MFRYFRDLNLPNKLTVLRIVAIPVFFLFLLLPVLPGLAGSLIFGVVARVLAAAFFLGAAITDLLDGKLARKYGLVTELGKFLDPIADKLMVFAAFFGLLCLEHGDTLFTLLLASAALLTLTREFAVTGLRTMASAAEGGKIIPAGMLGKIKTVGQIVFVMCALLEPLLFSLFLGRWIPFFAWVGEYRVLTYAAMLFMTVMTVVSGIDYFRAYFLSKKVKK